METSQLSAILSSMGQATRLEIVKLLAPLSKSDNGLRIATGMQSGIPAGKIADILGLAPPTLSFHLKDMTLRNILIQKRVGREIHYLANLDLILQALEGFVTELEK
jgi:ArsR family transcriptional regulator, arsenate/arsenite/antimonite-responsive transcriptional repressor